MKEVIAVLLLVILFTVDTEAREPPPALIQAVARQESGLNPLAVNVAGRSHRPATREEAEALIRQAQAAGKSFDVGLMQINSWWIRRHKIPPASLLDPHINRAWGTWILQQEIARHGFNWKAVGKYHSPDPERGRRYAWQVFRYYAGPCASHSREAGRAEQKTDPQNLSQPAGVRRNPGIRRPGRIIAFDVQQADLPWLQRSKSGTP